MLGPAGRSRRTGLLALLLLVAASLSFVSASAWAQTFPALTGRVVDAANIIPDDQEAALTAKLAALETQSGGRQLVVATLPSLEGYEISDYGYRLGRAWEIGSKEKNDGALLIVAPTERKVRIEVGYGLEGIVTDGLSSLVIQDAILPRFKAGDMPGGIVAGADALITQLTLPEGEARIAAAKAQAPPPSSVGDVIFPIIFFGFMFLIMFVVPMMRRARGKGYQPSGLGPVILWTVADAIASGRSSSGGGGFGGGGFSGGGGSFGGGGSSGSW